MRVGLKGSLFRIKPSLSGRLFLFSILLAAAFFLPANLPAHLTSPYEEEALSVFSLAPPLLRLPEVQVSLLFSESSQLKEEALAITAKNVMEYLRPKDDSEGWQALAVRLPADAVALALSRAPEEGIICFLAPGERDYSLVFAREGFLPIEELRLWPMGEGREDDTGANGAGAAGAAESQTPAWLLALTEKHDEKLGAYSKVRRFSLLLWSEEKLVNAFETNLSWQLAFPRGQAWIGAEQKVSVSGSGGSLDLTCRQTYCQSEGFQAALLSPEDWTRTPGISLLSELDRDERREYRYAPEYQAFGLAKGLWRPAGQEQPLPVLVIADLERELEGPFSAREEYLLKTSEGLSVTAPKTEVILETW